MKKTFMAAAFALAAAGFALPTSASAAPVTATQIGAALGNDNAMTTEVQYRGYRRGGRGWHRGYHAGYRYRHRPHYGTIVGGIALGALLAGSAYAYSRPPAPGLCWYWADPYERHGYWDYC